MAINNINTEAMGKFVEEVKANPEAAKKTKKVEGTWNFTPGEPQFEAVLEFKRGSETVRADFAPFMGGGGMKPDPIQYCLFGMASCYAGTFVSLAAMEGIELSHLSVTAENRVELTRTLGLSDNPIVESVKITLDVKTGAPEEKIRELQRLAYERCPGVYCLTNPIRLETEVKLI
ncbi:MAG: OsmC family protein [bacterium]